MRRHAITVSGFTKVDGFFPLLHHLRQEDPEHAFAVVNLGSLDGALEYGELVTKGDILQGESLSILREHPDQYEQLS